MGKYQTDKTEKLIKCKKCGEAIPEKGKLCPHCGAKNKRSHPVLLAILIIGIIGAIATGGSSDAHIYDNAQVKDVMNGTRDAKIGEYSIVKVSSAEVTDEALVDWSQNHIAKNGYNYGVIVYTDKSDNLGVFATSPELIVKDVHLVVDDYGDYMSGTDGTHYSVKDGNTLIPW